MGVGPGAGGTGEGSGTGPGGGSTGDGGRGGGPGSGGAGGSGGSVIVLMPTGVPRIAVTYPTAAGGSHRHAYPVRGVLTGFAAIWVVTLVGYLIGRFELLGPSGPTVLARLVFFVAAPALLLTTLVRAPLAQVFTGALAAFALSTVLAAAAYVAITLLVHRYRRTEGPDAGTGTRRSR